MIADLFPSPSRGGDFLQVDEVSAEIWEYGDSHIQGVANAVKGLYWLRATPAIDPYGFYPRIVNLVVGTGLRPVRGRQIAAPTTSISSKCVVVGQGLAPAACRGGFHIRPLA